MVQHSRVLPCASAALAAMWLFTGPASGIDPANTVEPVTVASAQSRPPGASSDPVDVAATALDADLRANAADVYGGLEVVGGHLLVVHAVGGGQAELQARMSALVRDGSVSRDAATLVMSASFAGARVSIAALESA